MKFFLMLVLVGSPAFAGGQSSFRLLDTKCEEEAHEKLETTPQSPPLAVDDPSTPGCNQWEVNLLVSGDLSTHDRTLELPLLDINYGIGDNLQLKYEVPNQSVQTSDGSTHGIGNSKAGIKYKFFDNEELNLEMAFYPQVEFINGTSDKEVTLPLLLSKKIGQTTTGDLMLTTNLSYNISTEADTPGTLSVLAGLGMPLSSKVTIMGELSADESVAQNASGTRDQLIKADVGLMGPVSKNVILFGSLGESIYSSDSKNHGYFVCGVRL